jgi:hypothetical protein
VCCVCNPTRGICRLRITSLDFPSSAYAFFRPSPSPSHRLAGPLPAGMDIDCSNLDDNCGGHHGPPWSHCETLLIGVYWLHICRRYSQVLGMHRGCKGATCWRPSSPGLSKAHPWANDWRVVCANVWPVEVLISSAPTSHNLCLVRGP